MRAFPFVWYDMLRLAVAAEKGDMPQIYKCTVCLEQKSMDSRSAAVDSGWVLVDVTSKQRTRYFVSCPACVPPWLKNLIEEKKK